MHNAENTISTCIESVCDKLPPNCEVIVVDDGSTDESLALVRKYAMHNPQISIVAQANKGRGAARNYGMSLARGTFVGFVDADDAIDPQMYKKMLDCAEQTSADIVICDYAAKDKHLSSTLFVFDSGVQSDYGTDFRKNPEMIRHFGASCCNKISLRSLWGASSEEGSKPLVFPEHIEIEDVATIYPLLTRASHVEKIDEVLYFYRQHSEGSISGTYDAHYIEILESLKIMLSRISSYKPNASSADASLLHVVFMHAIKGRFNDLFSHAPIEISRAYLASARTFLNKTFPGWQRESEFKFMFPSRCLRTLISKSSLDPILLAFCIVKRVLREQVRLLR